MEAIQYSIILDTDAGICNDDCLALFLALSSNRIKLEGISACAGNYSMKQCLFNILSILEYLEIKDIPVFPGSYLPLNHCMPDNALNMNSKWIDQNSGIWPFGGPSTLKPQKQLYLDWMIDKLSNPSLKIKLVAIGPLTNIAKLMNSKVYLPGLDEIIIMGGAINSLPLGHGNVTSYAEFNFWVDPEAASLVLNSKYPIKIIPLNFHRIVWFDFKCFYFISKLRTKISDYLRTILIDYFSRPNFKISLGDALTIGTILWPNIFKFQVMDVKVITTHNSYYGYLKESKGKNNTPWIQVLVSFDKTKFINYYLLEMT